MDTSPQPHPDERVLVLAPTRTDAALCATILGEAGFPHCICADLATLVEAIGQGVAVVLLTDESLGRDDPRGLVAMLERQPAWSDLPILLLCGRSDDSRLAAWALDALGNVPILERPIHVTTLVSALRASVRARRRQYELRESDRGKDEFLATLSHELRNPLAPLRNCLHVLHRSGTPGDAVRPLYALMERQVNQLVRLVDDLLELSRVTRGALSLRIERVKLADILKSAIETSEPAIAAGGHRLLVALPPRTVWLDGDPVRLAQIVGNLLTNAARYTDPGGEVTVEGRVEEDGVVIAVRDNGSGISAEALPRVFDMFSRGDRKQHRGEAGLGIGLGIARRLAEMHRGTLEAHSAGTGRGSEFLVRLPAAGPAPGAALETPEEAVVPPARILIVDDNRDAADSLRMVLEALGSEVRLANDGPEALAVYAAWSPAIVLMDIGMPGMDGYEVARRLRAAYPAAGTSLIALTGWGQEEDRRLAAAAGFDHHLVKPVEIAALRTLLASLSRATGVHEASQAVATR